MKFWFSLLVLVACQEICLGSVLAAANVHSAFRVKRIEVKAFSCIGLPDGPYPNPDDPTCHTFYKCSNGIAYLYDCPNNLMYNPSTQECDYNVPGCAGYTGTRPTSTAIPTTTASQPTTRTSAGQSTVTMTAGTTTTARPTVTVPGGGTFTCPAPDGFFPIPGACSSDYFSCVSGSPYVLTCPNSAIFDPVLLMCVPAHEASCRSTEFQCPSSEGFFPIPGQCTGLHYVCIAGDAFLQYCPGSSIFDPLTCVCVDQELASCKA